MAGSGLEPARPHSTSSRSSCEFGAGAGTGQAAADYRAGYPQPGPAYRGYPGQAATQFCGPAGYGGAGYTGTGYNSQSNGGGGGYPAQWGAGYSSYPGYEQSYPGGYAGYSKQGGGGGGGYPAEYSGYSDKGGYYYGGEGGHSSHNSNTPLPPDFSYVGAAGGEAGAGQGYTGEYYALG